MPALIPLTSPDFAEGAPIPAPNSKPDGNEAPTLEWSGVPDGTVEIAILMEDPDTPMGTFAHWLAAGIDPSTRRIDAGKLPVGSVEGPNGFGETGYGGPQPPEGDGVHRYFFNVYALNRVSNLTDGFTVEELRRAVAGSELARGVLIGTYER